ncbi:mRNA 3' end processing factor [Kalmusia sp. IMI 367209]|nr:mRNA 3' end processing factor [Kalmusia sp. IMI 367209]
MSSVSDEVAADFRDALQDLKVNSRPEISNLTLIAKENTEHAQAISLVLEQHIRTARPDWRLPSLYVLDSIVKNIGTPYTVYLGRGLYKTFTDTYLKVDQPTRKAMEGLLRTWKQPVPESMDSRPVFPPEMTGDIETALNKMHAIQAQQPMQRPVHALPARPAASAAWRSTPTPPQNGVRHADQYSSPQYGQYPQSGLPQDQYSHPQTFPQPLGSLDLDELKAEVGKLISSTQQAFAYNLSDTSLQQKLNALLALKKVLDTQTLPPQQLEAVRNQIRALAPAPAPTPAPIHMFIPPASVPPVVHTPQLPAAPAPQPPASAPPLNLAQLLANFRPSAPSVPNPPPAPAPSTPNLAELMQRISTPPQPSSTPAIAPFYSSPFSGAPMISTPVPAPAIPAPALAAIPAATATTNLAELLASINKPGAATPATPTSMAPLPQVLSLPQMLSQPAGGAPAPPNTAWIVNALSGLANSGTPSNVTPLGSEPMTRQSSAPTNVLNDIELTTASIKKPRLYLISRLYEAKPNICTTCGRRFEATAQGKEKKARHMDWHFKMKDPDAAKRGIHRSWVKKQAKDRYVLVPQDAAIAHAPCPICQENFEPQWSKEANDFVWMDAIKVGGKIYHATCWEEYSKGAGIATPSTPDSVLGKRTAETGTPASGKKLRAY